MDTVQTHEKLKRLRQRLNLSQNAAARVVRVSQRTFSGYEDGTRPIPPGVAELFCLKRGLQFEIEFPELI